MSKRHPRPRRSSALLLAALAVVGFRDGSTRGASIVAPLDLGEMALESDAVLLADARRSTAVRRGALIFTNTEFVVRAVVEGTPRPDAIGSDGAVIPGAIIPGAVITDAVITVQTPGGELDGTIWHVPGSPRFVSGVRYLLFLRQKDPDPDPDAGGRLWLPLTLSHGLLREAKSPVGSILLTPVDRHPAGSLPRPDGRIPEPVGTYYEVELLEHLGEVVDGRSAWDRRRVEVREEDLPTSGAAAGVPRICSFFENGGRKFRWRAFDSGGSATIRADSRGDLSLPGGGFQQVVQALDTWMSITGTSMNLVFGGPVELDNNCGSRAQGNTIVFNDPCSDIPDVQGCGGVLAFGGPTTSGTHRFDGATWVTISGWIVVVNNGVGCLGADNWRILVAHELGHGLGFGHVADTGALMFSNCCNEPNSTDTTCARFTYPARDPLNRRPTVDAGSSATVTLARHRLRIAGSASDDARPAVPGDLTTTWRLLGGPGAVSFDDAASPATAVSFSEPGTYVLGLTASDGELLRTDSVQLSVELWAGSVARRTFQQGMGGYRGTVDTFLQENAAARNNARSPELSVDSDDPRDSNLASQALLRFDAIFGDRSGQVEPGADVRGAALELSSTNQGDGATLHRMDGPWGDRDTWSRFGGNGVQAGGEALRRADASVAAAGGAVRIDVTPSLRAWSADPASNHGWVFLPRGTNGWDFFSAEGETPPRLTVDFAITEDETLVAAGDVWRYRRGSSAPEADWKELGFRPGAAWVSGPTGIGYGDGDDRTVLQDMRNSYGSIFARREFQVDDPSFL
ncbi:MAG: DNRLRE domain-containing protein, partial [Planctomycetota bacterium]|nr:DNRLRE domain-containing protein [Planctomycetota bacterium]